MTSNDHSKIFGTDGDILYHDFGDHLMSKYMSKLTKSHTLNSGILLQVNCISIEFILNLIVEMRNFECKKISKVILTF